MIIKGLLYIVLVALSLIILNKMTKFEKCLDTLQTCSKLYLNLTGKKLLKRNKAKTQKRDLTGKFIK